MEKSMISPFPLPALGCPVKGGVLSGEVCVGEVISLTLDPSPLGRGKLWFSSPFGIGVRGEGESGSFVKASFNG
jgi:hypothetical protein